MNFTHKGSIDRPSLGWRWSEKLRETKNHWVSSVVTSSGKVLRYRKKDGKLVGGEDILNLSSITEQR